MGSGLEGLSRGRRIKMEVKIVGLNITELKIYHGEETELILGNSRDLALQPVVLGGKLPYAWYGWVVNAGVLNWFLNKSGNV